MLPEEKMAIKILARANLIPPFNLLALTEQYAAVEFRSFPVEADGVTIGMGGASKPNIIINSDKPKTRQQFTLAHELGHVIIPWHTGIVASHVNGLQSGDFEYREMESEANRFASELLMPSAWIKGEFAWGKSFSTAFEKTLEASGASRDAFLIKLFNTLEFPIFCVQVSGSGVVLKRYRCGGALSLDEMVNLQSLDRHFVDLEVNREEFSAGDRRFVAWVFQSINVSESDGRPWRDVLAQIVNETGLLDKVQSINAILPGQVNVHKHLDFDAVCTRVMLCYQNRPKIAAAVSHPLFKQYVIKRVRELRSRSV